MYVSVLTVNVKSARVLWIKQSAPTSPDQVSKLQFANLIVRLFIYKYNIAGPT